MLKISGLFILLYGMLSSSIAQHSLPWIADGIQGAGFPPSQPIPDLQDSIKKTISTAASPLEFEVPLNEEDSRPLVQVKDLRVLQVSLEKIPGHMRAELNIPLEFSIILRLPAFNPITFHMRMDMEVQLYLVKNEDGSYRLVFGHCRISPDTLRIESDSLGPATQFIEENMQRSVKNMIANNLGDNMCQLINSWLYNLNPKMTNELINLILQSDTYQLAI